MTTSPYQQMIIEAIRGLPEDLLAEVADFVYFLRGRALDPEGSAQERRTAELRFNLRHLSRQEVQHLEQEFEGYDRRYPRE